MKQANKKGAMSKTLKVLLIIAVIGVIGLISITIILSGVLFYKINYLNNLEADSNYLNSIQTQP